MRRSSKREIRSSKQIRSGISNAETPSKFDFRFFASAFLFVALRGLAATNISAGDDLAKLRPPREELPPTFWEQQQLPVLLGSFVFLALIVVIVWYVTRPKPPVIVPPEIRAKQALDPLLTRPEDGIVLSQVSQILRRYIAEAFSLSAGELTTGEFCRLATAHEAMGPELANAVCEFLRRCDERKFAASPPTAPMAAVANSLKLVSAAQARLAELRRRSEAAALHQGGASVPASRPGEISPVASSVRDDARPNPAKQA